VTPPTSDLATLWLSCHVDYACRHSGACCRSGWPLPVDSTVVPAIAEAVVRGRVCTVDGRANWLDGAGGVAAGVAGTFRQVDRGCVFHAPAPPVTGLATARARYCGVHAALGHQALPSSCQHFPRVCLIDDRGVRVSLSHYCPTAASLLVDSDRPVTIVAGPPAVPSRPVPEGLDVRDSLPPRLTDDVLTDHDGASAWERHVVATLAGVAREATVERAVARITDDARRLAEWRPAMNTTLADAVSRLAMESSTDLDGMADRLGDPSAWPAWFAVAADACQGAWLADALPANLAGLDARYVAPSWSAHAGAAGRYLAAKAFGSWIAYQADAAVTLSRWLTLCHAVLRVECARACGDVDRPLDRDRLVQAIRQADLLLVHYADSLAIARTLGNRSGEAASG
jgi:hypothetical protein